ncbi:DUF6422 family protein [Inquilinus ginsengisoli]|uniref:DUF6422 family protein n=1 Tax=Inquilinus ginsengisoli TaxID=363840 RepID=UPI003D24D7AE
MSVDLPSKDERTAEQADAIEQAAMLIINARNEAAALLARAGMQPPDSGWWGSPCGVTLPPPPQDHRCGCRNYTGDGGPCRTRYADATGPDTGTGSGWPTARCGHLPSEHVET